MIFSISVFSTNTNLAFANDSSANLPFGWKFQNDINDWWTENLIFDQEEKAERHAEYFEETQKDIEELIRNNEPVPEEFYQRADMQIEKITIIENQEQLKSDCDKVLCPFEVDEKETDFGMTFRNLIKINQVNDIRNIISDYNEYKRSYLDGKITYDELLEKTVLIDNRINSLEIVQDNCTSEINSANYLDNKSVYSKVKEICPILQDYSIDELQKIIKSD